MQILCPYNQPCVDDQASLGNFSAEDPDILLFHSVRYKNQFPDPNPDPFYACLGLCVSWISQAEADLCAENNAALCEANPPVPPSPPPTPGLHVNPPGAIPTAPPVPNTKVQNTVQTCLEACEDGARAATVAAGHNWGANLDDANTRARSFCEQQLAALGCLTPFFESWCIDVDIGTHYITTDNLGVDIDFTWTVVGSLPPGLSMSDHSTEAVFTGTPTTGGTFTFVIQATTAWGVIFRSYTVRVMEITTPAILPDAEEDTPYSTTLATNGDQPPVTWTLADGSYLPDGLSLDLNTGEISGTPTVPNDFIFTIIAVDSSDPSLRCEKEFFMHVEENIFKNVIWTLATTLNNGVVAAATGLGKNGSVQVETKPLAESQPVATASGSITINHVGPDISCNVEFVVSDVAFPVTPNTRVDLYKGGAGYYSQVAPVTGLGIPANTYNVPFTVSAGNIVYKFYFAAECVGGVGVVGKTTITAQIQIL